MLPKYFMYRLCNILHQGIIKILDLNSFFNIDFITNILFIYFNFLKGSLEELPKNGDEWHWIRQGNLKDLTQCSDRFKKLLLVSLTTLKKN